MSADRGQVKRRPRRRAPMNVLHLYANHKWTGPADLALLLVHGLAGRALAGGRPVEPALALAGWVHDGMEHAVARRAADLDLRCVEGLALRRHFHLGSRLRDAHALAAWVDAGRADLLHCHQPGDHFTAAVAVGLAARRVPIVRSLWEGEAPVPMPRARFMFARTADVLVPFADLAPALGAAYDFARARVHEVPPPLDPVLAEALPAARAEGRRALRAELGLGGDALLVGVTARIQRRRRWDLMWEVTARLVARRAETFVAVLGRADDGVFAEVCSGPLAARGLTDRVRFLGYRSGAAYTAALAAFDAFVFLVPGSDATCRALREAMAAGLPVVCTDLGHLPDIVADGETGFVRPAEPDPLCHALATLAGDAVLRAEIGRRAREAACRRWSLDRVTRQVLAVYDRIEALS